MRENTTNQNKSIRCEYPAHIDVLPDGTKRIQTLEEHLAGTSKYAEEFLSGIGLGKTGMITGFGHDMGKARDESKKRLETLSAGQVAKPVIHTFQTCHFFLEGHDSSALGFEEASMEMRAFSSSGHHSIFDCIDIESGSSGFDHRAHYENIGYESCREFFIKTIGGEKKVREIIGQSDEELGIVYQKIMDMTEDDAETSFYLGLVARLLTSAVVDADRCDTGAFYGNTYPVCKDDMASLWQKSLSYMETKLDSFRADTLIRKTRRKLSDLCRGFADRAPGVYRLNLPTGAGKTLSSLRYALAHAAKWNKKRIFFIAPLLSIIDQNSAVIREYIGNDEIILEHTSNLAKESEAKEENLRQTELLTETWNVPVVITTLYQFLNTLFSGKMSSVRRFHSLSESVVVIDEVQSVPYNMLSLFNLAVNFLSEICKTTVILCSATQPCFEKTRHPLLSVPEDIVPYDKSLWAPFKRTRIIPQKGMTLDEIQVFIQEQKKNAKSILVICNTRGEARTLYENAKNQDDFDVFHLSASMCMAHRTRILKSIKTRLESLQKSGRGVICISTQLIESGVDISFQRVIRLAAGLDKIIQAAGRENREGESEGADPFYVIPCLGEKLAYLPDIGYEKSAYMRLAEEYKRNPDRYKSDLSSDEAVRRYYSILYQSFPEDYQDYPTAKRDTIFNLLAGNVNAGFDSTAPKYILNQAFKAAGESFNVYDENTIDIVVPYGKGIGLIKSFELAGMHPSSGFLKNWRKKIKPYTISIQVSLYQKLLEKGIIREIGEVAFLSYRSYNRHTGLNPKTVI